MTQHPIRLFKYRDDSQRTQDIITNRKVWLPTPDQLNDPLECQTGRISANLKSSWIRKMEDAQMSGFLMSAMPSLEGTFPFYSLSYREARLWFDRLKQLGSREEKYALIRTFLSRHGQEISKPLELFETFERQLAQVGVFSLSEDPANSLMWAHYGASHSGIAIGFKCEAGSALDSDIHLLPVAYDNVKPTPSGGFISQISIGADHTGRTVSTQKIGFRDPTFRAAIATKPVEWSYEREWRYVEEASGLYPWPAPVDTIVFGLRMPADRRLHYAALIGASTSLPVEFLEIARSESDSGLTIVPWRDKV